MNWAYAYILFFDMPGDPNEITARLGLVPTRVERKGQLRGKTELKNDSWVLESPTERKDYILENHVRDLLALIEPKKKEIRVVADECFGRFTLVGYFHHANDGFRLSKEQVLLISEMGLELECDLYFLGEEEPSQ